MTRIDPVKFQGQDIVPIQFLAKLLPDPASLGPLTKGKTCIGDLMRGTKDGKEKTVYVYNICDHEACYAEVGSQAISYTTGVPAMMEGRSPSSRISRGWHSGSPKRTLYSSTLGPSAVIIKPA